MNANDRLHHLRKWQMPQFWGWVETLHECVKRKTPLPGTTIDELDAELRKLNDEYNHLADYLREEAPELLGLLPVVYIGVDPLPDSPQGLAERMRQLEAGLRAKLAEKAEPVEATTGKTKRKNVNGQMLATILAKPESRGWTAAQWAAYLKCSRSAVVETQAWRELATARELQKVERQKATRRRSKGR